MLTKSKRRLLKKGGTGKKAATLGRKWNATIVKAGFTPVPNALLDHQAAIGLSSTELTVLLQIMKHAWKSDREAWPSHRRLAEAMGVTTRTVQRAIDALVDMEVLDKDPRYREDRGGQTTNLYSLAPLVTTLTPYAREMVKERARAADLAEARRKRRIPKAERVGS